MNQIVIIGDNSPGARDLRKYGLDQVIDHVRLGEPVPQDVNGRTISQAWNIGGGDVALVYPNELVVVSEGQVLIRKQKVATCSDPNGEPPWRPASASDPPLSGEYIVIHAAAAATRMVLGVTALEDGDVQVLV